MSETSTIDYDAKRRKLIEIYKPTNQPAGASEIATGGVDHLALICSDIERTIEFYTEVLGMTLSKVVPNRDEPTSTHIFLDMGGGNLLAFFDFPKNGPVKTQRGVGSMHHLALKVTPERFAVAIAKLRARGIEHDIHGDESKGSVYFRDPDDILLELTSGY